jgi:hypothetical protein
MPLEKAKNNTKKEINKAVSDNIKELHAHGTRPRSQKQIIAIAEAAARKED